MKARRAVCKTLIIESLKNNLADGVYTLRKTGRYPYAEGEFYTKENIPRYDDIPNSVYHSVLACREVKKNTAVRASDCYRYQLPA